MRSISRNQSRGYSWLHLESSVSRLKKPPGNTTKYSQKPAKLFMSSCLVTRMTPRETNGIID